VICARDGDCFRTDHLLTDLRRRTVSSGFVTLAAQGAKVVLNIGSLIVLARLLTPQDFGVVAMATTTLGFLRVFRDAGLSTATVQKESITHAQVSNLFWANVALSGLLSLIVVASAPAIAWFFHDRRLIAITILLSVTYLLSGSTVQPQALLNRQMRFKALAMIEIGSKAAGLVTGVLMALSGFGYWSLVGASLATEGASLLLTWPMSDWRPQAPRRNVGTRPLLKFGAGLTAGGSMNSLSQGVDSLLIGRSYGADSLGFYSRAMALLMRPSELLLGPINSVMLPILAKLQGDPKRYRRSFLQVYETLAFAGLALTGILLALSRPLTLVLLGPKWEQAAVIFGGFTLAAMYRPLSASSSWLFISQGRGDEFFLMNSILSVLAIVAVFVGLPYGPLGVALAYSVSGLLIRLPILFYLAGRRGPVSTWDLWIGFFHHLPVWGGGFAASWLARLLFADSSPLVQLAVCGTIGTLGALCFVGLLPAPRGAALRCLGALRDLKTAPAY